MVKEWGPFQTFVEQLGESAVAALRNLESGFRLRNKQLLPYHLRCLHGLYTPESRSAVQVAMAAPQAGLEEVAAAAEKAMADQWIGFVWRPENPRLHRDIGVTLSSRPL